MLNNYRNEINKIDDQIINLLKERMLISKKIGDFKKENNIPVLNSNRESEVLNRIINYNNNIGFKLEENFIKNIWTNIMDYSKQIQN